MAILTHPSMEYILTQVPYLERKLSFDISTKTHLLELLTFSRLPSARTLSWAELSWANDPRGSNSLRWNVYFWTSDRVTFLLFHYVAKYAVFTTPLWRVSILLLFRDEHFKQHVTKYIDRSIECSQSTTYWVSELDNCIAAWLNISPYTWFKTRWNGILRRLKYSHLLLICIFVATFYATEILSWVKSGKYRNEWPC